MAVVTIDAKAELAQLQAAQDAEEGKAPTTDGETKEAKTETKEPNAETKTVTTDPDDIEGDDGLTPRQKRDFTQAMQRTIGKKHRERKEAEEFAAAQYAERRLAEQRAEAAERELAKFKESQPVPRETVDPEAGKPTRDKFDSDQAYWDAYVDWRAERKAAAKIAEQRAEDARAAEERRTNEVLETARTSIGRALELVPDFAEVTGAIDAEVPPVVAGYMQKSDMFAELGYHLAKNPDILARISKLPPDEQLVTIGKIEGTLKPFEPKGSKADNGATPSTTAANGREAEPIETGSTPSRARSSAPVITPLNGNSGAAVEKAPSEMNIRETIADWQKRNRANLGLRKRH